MTALFIIIGIIAFIVLLWAAIKFEFIGDLIGIIFDIFLAVLGSGGKRSSGSSSSGGSGFGSGSSGGGGADGDY